MIERIPSSPFPPVVIPLTCMPSKFEPCQKGACRDLVARLIQNLWGGLYPQVRKISPEIAQCLCEARTLSSVSHAILKMSATFHETLMQKAAPVICKIIKTRYTSWTRAPFYPNGCMYTAWLAGRLHNNQEMVLKQSLERFLLTTDHCVQERSSG